MTHRHHCILSIGATCRQECWWGGRRGCEGLSSCGVKETVVTSERSISLQEKCYSCSACLMVGTKQNLTQMKKEARTEPRLHYRAAQWKCVWRTQAELNSVCVWCLLHNRIGRNNWGRDACTINLKIIHILSLKERKKPQWGPKIMEADDNLLQPDWPLNNRTYGQYD